MDVPAAWEAGAAAGPFWRDDGLAEVTRRMNGTVKFYGPREGGRLRAFGRRRAGRVRPLLCSVPRRPGARRRALSLQHRTETRPARRKIPVRTDRRFRPHPPHHAPFRALRRRARRKRLSARLPVLGEGIAAEGKVVPRLDHAAIGRHAGLLVLGIAERDIDIRIGRRGSITETNCSKSQFNSE